MTVWPSTLPLPYVDYSGQPLHVTLASRLENPRILRRSRFHAAVVGVSVQWELGIAEYDTFKTFHQDTLGCGTALFQISLRYPKASVLTDWKARFSGPYEAVYLDGGWQVHVPLDLVGLAATADPSPIVGWTLFLVHPDESPFVTADDFLYSVKV